MSLYLGNNKVSMKSGYITTGFKDFLEHGGKFSHTDYNDLTDILKYSDTENLTSMSYLFDSCNNLTTIPLLDTSKVTSMYKMFNECQKLSSIPLLDTSNVHEMSYMFYNCSNLTTIPLLDMTNVNSVSSMFGYCTNLISIPKLIIPPILYSLNSMFYGCTNLISIPQLNVSRIDDMSNIFYKCTNLEEIHMIGMKVKFNISSSTKFTREALVEILNNLAMISTTQTLTMGSTNLAKLTDADKQIATNKGWTLA